MFCTFQCITIYNFPRVAPLVLLWLAPSHKTLRFELNTLNLTLGGISVLHKTKYPIASGGLRSPDPLLQRSTTVISPPSQKILDPPLCKLRYSYKYFGLYLRRIFKNMRAKKLLLHHACQIPVNIWLTIMEYLHNIIMIKDIIAIERIQKQTTEFNMYLITNHAS